MEDFKIIQPSISDYFDGLSKDTLDEILTLYDGQEIKILDLIKKFELKPISVNTFRTHLSPIICHDFICPDCLTVSWKDHLARNKYSIPYCPECKNYLYSDFDPVKNEKEKLWRSNAWNSFGFYFDENTTELDPYENYTITRQTYSSLDYESKVFLGSLVANSLSEDLSTIQGWRLNNVKFYPLPEMTREVMSRLGFTDRTPELMDIEIATDVAQELLFPQKRLEGTIQEQFELWKKIAVGECKELLINEMEECGFHLRQGEIVNQIISKLLEDYSVGQVYNIIWRTVRNATQFYAKTDNRVYAANSVIHNCQMLGDKFKAEGKILDNYTRRYHSFQSEIARYYFDSVLKIGNVGIEKHPSPKWLLGFENYDIS
ncbi:hypothetical protein [Carboxylicivirga caseinilyticus]|uniref:hypothetical protein n=1 Tax=Carboxylicivirga caseinilyticus TaxID=3417572 RepID=UPI003D34955E|nr:hypothetical protein [Marinilabiliaceae bacterium A049]